MSSRGKKKMSKRNFSVVKREFGYTSIEVSKHTGYIRPLTGVDVIADILVPVKMTQENYCDDAIKLFVQDCLEDNDYSFIRVHDFDKYGYIRIDIFAAAKDLDEFIRYEYKVADLVLRDNIRCQLVTLR